MSSEKGRLIIISAPSGAGKGTVIERLMKLCPQLVLSVSATTRAPRAGEVDGISYDFVTREKFHEMIARDEFLEYAEYVGELYGTPIKQINEHIGNGRDVILEIEVQGAKQVMAVDPNALAVFIIPPDMEDLERRLRRRGSDLEEKLIARLEMARIELEERKHFAHVVLNDYVSRAAKEISLLINK